MSNEIHNQGCRNVFVPLNLENFGSIRRMCYEGGAEIQTNKEVRHGNNG